METKEAIERAKTALEHRIYVTERILIPEARENRNKGIEELLIEALEKDKVAIELI